MDMLLTFFELLDVSHLLAQQLGPVVEQCGHIRVLRTQGLFENLLAPRIQRLSLSVLALARSCTRRDSVGCRVQSNGGLQLRTNIFSSTFAPLWGAEPCHDM